MGTCTALWWAFLVSAAAAYLFEDGYEHHYTYVADTNTLGLNNMTITLKFAVGKVNGTETSWLLWLQLQSFTQYTKDGIFGDNPLKWDLTKRFLFRMSADGVVTESHVHPEDLHEVLLLKKALASTLSGRVHKENQLKWQYESQEIDHLGDLRHSYTGEVTRDGFKLKRHHRSLKRIERIHSKTLHYTSDGTLYKVEAEDQGILENRFPEFQPRKPIPGEKILKHRSEGEIDKFHAHAKVQMELTLKKKTNQDPYHPHDSILIPGDLVFKKKFIETSLKEDLESIENIIKCVHSYSDKAHEDRTKCVIDLRSKLQTLNKADFEHFVTQTLSGACAENDTLCLDRRYLFIDIVSRLGDPLSQTLTNKWVLNGTEEEEDIRRALFHYSTLETPLQESINAVEHFCFGVNDSLHGSLNLTRTQIRACLSLGAIAKAVSKSNETEAARLMSKVEQWILKQEDAHPRSRRGIQLEEEAPDSISQEHLMSRFVLLHSLGNAGLQSSLPHILEYTRPNSRQATWRRAALSSLRLYTCHTSAKALLKTLYTDKVDSVRKTAMDVYKDHPVQRNLSQHAINEILSKNYSYPELIRIKRDFSTWIIVDFRLELPEYHWKREVGSSAAGASFGVDFVNKFELQIQPLSGFVHINIHDRAFAEAHIGIIHYKIDILLIEVCYRGHIDYNLNVLKDYKFGADDFLQGEYDKVAKDLIKPLKIAVENVRNVFDNNRGGIVTELTESIKPIPEAADALVNSSLDLQQVTSDIQGLVWVPKLQRAVYRLSSFAEDFKEDAADFYDVISDAGLIVLPYAEKEMIDGINLITEAQKIIGEKPRGGFSNIETGQARMKLAMGRLLEAKSHIADFLSSGGTPPLWLNSLAEITSLKEILFGIQSEINNSSIEDFPYAQEDMFSQISLAIESTVHQLENVQNVAISFQNRFAVTAQDIKRVKLEYENMQIQTKGLKTKMEMVFGKKFYKGFPEIRRKCDDKCRCGTWPTTTGGKYENMPGIDLVTETGYQIPMPVSGLVLPGNQSDEVVIIPSDNSFPFKIMISNIEPNSTFNASGTYLDAGQELGVGKSDLSECEDKYVHLAIFKDGEFLDPSMYIDHIDITPKWITECKDFTFKHIGSNVDAGSLGGVFVALMTELKQRALEWAENKLLGTLEDMFPNSKFFKMLPGIVDAFKHVLHAASDLRNTMESQDETSFEDFSSTMQSVSEISNSIGEVSASMGGLLESLGINNTVTSAFGMISDASEGLAKSANIAVHVHDQIHDFQNGKSFSQKAVSVSQLLGSAGEGLSVVAGVLKDFGVNSSVTNILDKAQIVANAASSITLTSANIANGFKDKDGFSKVTAITGGISSVTNDVGKVLSGLGASSDVMNVVSQVQAGASLANNIAHVAKNTSHLVTQHKGEFMSQAAALTSGIDQLMHHVNEAMTQLGADSDAMNIMAQIQSGSSLINGLANTASNLHANLKQPNNTNLQKASIVASGLGSLMAETSKFVANVGVSGDAVQILNQIQAGSLAAGKMIDHLGTSVTKIKNAISNKDISGSLQNSVAGIGILSGDIADALGTFGVGQEYVDVLNKMHHVSEGTANIMSTAKEAIINAKNITNPLDGLALTSQVIGNISLDFGHILNATGANKDTVDALGKIHTGASGISDMSNHLNEGISNSKIKNNSNILEGIGHVSNTAEILSSDLHGIMQTAGASKDTLGIVDKFAEGSKAISNMAGDLNENLVAIKNESDLLPIMTHFSDAFGQMSSDMGNLLDSLEIQNDDILLTFQKVSVASQEVSDSLTAIQNFKNTMHQLHDFLPTIESKVNLVNPKKKGSKKLKKRSTYTSLLNHFHQHNISKHRNTTLDLIITSKVVSILHSNILSDKQALKTSGHLVTSLLPKKLQKKMPFENNKKRTPPSLQQYLVQEYNVHLFEQLQRIKRSISSQKKKSRSPFSQIDSTKKMVVSAVMMKGIKQAHRSEKKSFLKKVNIGAMKLREFIDLVNTSKPFIRKGVTDIEKAINLFINGTKYFKPSTINSLTVQNIQDILKKYRQKAEGDRMTNVLALQSLSVTACPSISKGIIGGIGHFCFPNEDCLGIQCTLPIHVGLQMQHVSFEINFSPSNNEVVLSENENRVSLNSDHQSLSYVLRSDNSLAVSLKIHVKGDWNTSISLDASASLCFKDKIVCLMHLPLLQNLQFNNRQKRAMKMSYLSRIMVNNMTVGHFLINLAKRNIPSGTVLSLMNIMKTSLKDEFTSKRNDGISSCSEEFKRTIDKQDAHIISPNSLDVTFFQLDYTFPCGPVGIELGFGGGGVIGISLKIDVRVKSGTSALVLTPMVSGKVWGSAGVSIGLLGGGIKLVGYILKTKFPVSLITKQSKTPVEIIRSLDLEIIPISLTLSAYVKVFGHTVFRKKFWEWTAPSFKANLFENRMKIKTDPPTFLKPCIVKQLEGRHPTNPAYMLKIYTKDDASDLYQTFAIGNFKGGTNVLSWTKFTGNILTVPTTDLPSGIPLYWTVKIKNSAGDEAVSTCGLGTYDTTITDGHIIASCPYSSHPHTINATLVAIDDSAILNKTIKGLGFSPSPYGTEMLPWDPVELKKSVVRPGVLNDMKYFSDGREGRLSKSPVHQSIKNTDSDCAHECLSLGKRCVAFDFEYHTQVCLLHDAVEGQFSKLLKKGMFKSFERLDVGFNSYIQYSNLLLTHGTVYYINVVLTNSLGYTSILSTGGTMVDFTPPLPGYLGSFVFYDKLSADGCTAAVNQRCKDVTWLPNHRKIIDGPGAQTVLNGHKPGEEEKYTISNNYISVNFGGFLDPESGIWGYNWAAGTKPCADDIVEFNDPHSSFSSPKFWTYTGFANDLQLPDGKYYLTVQALNNIECGGALVTTVCHSTPIAVDTTAPVFNAITDVMFDEDFDILVVYYNVSDSVSGIARVDFGLGHSKYDVDIRGYDRHDNMERYDPFFVVENLNLPPGVPAWIRVRAVNNVEMFASGHAPQPILIDKTPPSVGIVLDGNQLDLDIQYQHDSQQICSQWKNFYDPESGIKMFVWGVGLQPQSDDIVTYQNYSHRTQGACANVNLIHNQTYYSTVIAINDALNSKSTNSSSDGVLIDTTPPSSGKVYDGSVLGKDDSFSSEAATIKAVWKGFEDKESHIQNYVVSVFVNGDHKRDFDVENKTSLIDNSMSFEHLDRVYSKVMAVNGAELSSTAISDGFTLDLTPPLTIFVKDSLSTTGYQSNSSFLHVSWQFEDSESQIAKYRYYIKELAGGQKRKIWPMEKYLLIENIQQTTISKDINLQLKDGLMYFVSVTAFNNAGMSTSQESVGVIVDSSPPVIEKVLIGKPGEDEDLDENNNVLVETTEMLSVHWFAKDLQSGLESVFIAVSTTPIKDKEDQWKTFPGESRFALISNLDMKPSSNGTLYYVKMKVKNKAGSFSDIECSKPIFVQKANVPGMVFDGHQLLIDMDTQHDTSSIAMSFIGFESEACNIVGYQWAIGTQSFYSNKLPFTEYGIVMHNASFGHAQIHLDLYEGETYYITVRAKTGHRCSEDYILSSSNGIRVDTLPPDYSFTLSEENYPSNLNDNYLNTFQNQENSLNISWNVTDFSGIKQIEVLIGHLPFNDDYMNLSNPLNNKIAPGLFQFHHGETAFVTLSTLDGSGIQSSVVSPAITLDLTPPYIKNLQCTKIISILKSGVKCRWEAIIEYESKLENFYIAVSTKSSKQDIMNFTAQPTFKTYWYIDLLKEVKEKKYSKVIVTFKLTNSLGMHSVYERTIYIDITPPQAERIDVVTSLTPENQLSPIECQISTDFVEVNIVGLRDDESKIERYEFAVGKRKGSDEYLAFSQREEPFPIFLGDLNLPDGKAVFVTALIVNEAGLQTKLFSNPIIVSSNPTLDVFDGPNAGQDIDYQADISMLQGFFTYSDKCPITSADWTIEDLTGKIIATNKIQGQKFYNDELLLMNGFTYFNKIKIVDALNRTRISISDGVTIRIQPPSIGVVSDGGIEDQNFQESTTELSAYWHGFGSENSDDPTQIIDRYLVAIGDDNRYEKTRSNIYYFTDAGKNTSYIFQNLNLTAKNVKYFITVRAFSSAGSYQEATSNGIKVGYTNDIKPGTVRYNEAQNQTNFINVTWTHFFSDYGIRHYKLAVSTKQNTSINHSMPCNEFLEYDYVFDVLKPITVGTDLMFSINNLTLQHNQTYFVTVIAKDEIGLCLPVTGGKLLVDTSAPFAGNVTIEDVLVKDQVFFVKQKTSVKVEWKGFEDKESGISFVMITIFQLKDCQKQNSVVNVTVHDQIIYTFYGLSLEPSIAYYLELQVFNKAGLSITVSSPPFFLDETPPSIGTVKSGSSWKHTMPVQSSTSEIHASISIAKTKIEYECNIFKAADIMDWDIMPYASPECFQIKNDFVKIQTKYDNAQQNILKGGAVMNIKNLTEGSYSVNMKSLKGNLTVTSWAIASSYQILPNNYKLHDLDQLSNISSTNKTSSFTDNGFGIMVLGFIINDHFMIQCWVQDQYGFKSKWAIIDNSPFENFNKYEAVLIKEESQDNSYWNVEFIVNKKRIVTFNSVMLSKEMYQFAYGFLKDDYCPPIEDHFHPFTSEAIFKNLRFPPATVPNCKYGVPFFDEESGIKEIWVSLSDSLNSTYEETLYKTFCKNNHMFCPNNFSKKCNETQDLETIPINLSNLNLISMSKYANASSNQTFENLVTPLYYINVRVVNFAGMSTIGKTEAIYVDTTPPQFTSMFCADPLSSLDKPAMYQSSTSSLAAFWECEEDTSQISQFFIQMGTTIGSSDILVLTSVGKRKNINHDFGKSVLFDNSTYFITVFATNTANLSSSAMCNITIDRKYPDISNFRSKSLGTFINRDGPPNVSFMKNSNSIGIAWKPKVQDIVYYEWQIGSEPKQDDIFPRVLIGNSTTERVEIINGNLVIGQTEKTSIAEMMIKNMTRDVIENLDNIKQNSKFVMEPGRCLHISLLAVSRSNLKTPVPVQPGCIIRQEDVVTSFRQNRTHIIGLEDGHLVVKKQLDRYSRLSIKMTGEAGGVMVGLLNQTNFFKNYGTSANGRYKTYISNPDSISPQKSSRLILNRVVDYQDLSFYISPTNGTILTNWIDVQLHFNKSNIKENESPDLLYWDTAFEVWRHVSEKCIFNSKVDLKNGIFTATVCLDKNDTNSRRKRAVAGVVGYTVSLPRQFSLMILRNEFSNTPPRLLTSMFNNTLEDGISCNQLVVDDLEGDLINFTLIHQPVYGHANLSEDGQLCYKPNPDFNGVDNLTVLFTEVLGAGIDIQGHTITKNIELVVGAQNDAPDVYFGTSDHITLDSTVNNIDIKIESNDTSSYKLGTYIAIDRDGDLMQYDYQQQTIPGLEFHLKEIKYQTKLLPEVILFKYNNTNTFSARAFELSVTFQPKTTSGKAKFGFLVIDQSTFYSKVVWFTLYLLKNPCVYGHCFTKPETNLTCNSIIRAQDFSPFSCSCTPGYTGQWCQYEINECEPQPCPLMFDCTDEINNYQCNINIAKLMAILVCIVFAIGLVTFIIYKKKLKKPTKVSDIWGFSSTTLLRPETPNSFAFEENQEPVDQEPVDQKPVDQEPVEQEPESQKQETQGQDNKKQSELSKDKDELAQDLARILSPDISLPEFLTAGKALPPHHTNIPSHKPKFASRSPKSTFQPFSYYSRNNGKQDSRNLPENAVSNHDEKNQSDEQFSKSCTEDKFVDFDCKYPSNNRKGKVGKDITPINI